MRDDSEKWTPLDPLTEPQQLNGATLTQVTGLRQTLISGTHLLTTPAIGWPDIAQGAPYRIALRRDRLVEIGGAPRPEGWDSATGEASSDISDGWTIFDLAGPEAFALLKRGTEIALDTPSRSTARKLWGLDVWLYRHGAEDYYRMHIARSLDQALVGYLQKASELATE